MEGSVDPQVDNVLPSAGSSLDAVQSEHGTLKRAHPDEVDEDGKSSSSKKAKGTPGKTTTSKTPKSTPRQRKPPSKTVVTGRALARTWEEASQEDRMLITMRDENRNWADIRKEWELMTGEVVGGSTLPNRYARLKELMTVINEEDCARLIESLTEVEKAFQKEKWNLVAQSVVEKGGQKHKGSALLRQYRKMMTEHGTIPPGGVFAPDFQGDENDD